MALRAAGATRPSARDASALRLAAMSAASEPKKTRVLMVCLGNICRSPTAEAVFRAAVERAGLAGRYEVDSCGTGGGASNWYKAGGRSYHEGDAADARMAAAAAARGVELTSRSRPLAPADLHEFDLIVGMDAANLAAIRRAVSHWAGAGDAPPEGWEAAKLRLATDFARGEAWARYDSVPDPYYGGAAGFGLVLDLLDDCCGGMLEALEAGAAGGEG